MSTLLAFRPRRSVTMSDLSQTVCILGRLSAHRLCIYVTAYTLVVGGAWVSAEGTRTVSQAIPALQETPVRQYRALRRMHAANEKFNQEGWLECWTEFDERGFRYEIVAERGSDYIRDKVLKTLLRREQELISGGNAGRAEINEENYLFAEGGDAQDLQTGERTVILKPKRKDMLLVDGRMVINQEGTELLRVEGRLSKNPSFWTSLVDVVREFARVDGVRVPIATDTVARLKFAGTSRLDVRYHYETINGRPVSLAARQLVPMSLTR
jgi:uncharacterized protein YjlB